jgi:hypothetical protein
VDWQEKGFMSLTVSYCGSLHILFLALHKPPLVGMIEEARDKGVSHQLTATSLGLTQMKPWSWRGRFEPAGSAPIVPAARDSQGFVRAPRLAV